MLLIAILMEKATSAIAHKFTLRPSGKSVNASHCRLSTCKASLRYPLCDTQALPFTTLMGACTQACTPPLHETSGVYTPPRLRLALQGSVSLRSTLMLLAKGLRFAPPHPNPWLWVRWQGFVLRTKKLLSVLLQRSFTRKGVSNNVLVL